MATLTPFGEVQVALKLSVHGSESRLITAENACTTRTVVYEASVRPDCSARHEYEHSLLH